MNDQDLKRAWESYSTCPNNKNKNILVSYYYNLVNKIASSLSVKMNERVSRDELTSYGLDGLYKAIEGYDLKRKIKFETYAYRRIQGSMIDALRSNDWIPRSVRIRQQKIEKSKKKLESKLKRKVTDEEAVLDAGFNIKDYNINPKKYNATICSSVDTPLIETDNESQISQDSNKYLSSKKEPSVDAKIIRKEFLKKVVEGGCSENEKKIIYYYYYKNMTMREISNKLNISESRISQIHQKLLIKLRDEIKQNAEYFGEDIISLIAGCNSQDSVF